MPPQLLSLDPRTGAVVGSFTAAREREVLEAVYRARDASGHWAERSLGDRVEAVRRIQESVLHLRHKIEAAITSELGRPLQETLGAEILPTLNALSWLTRNAAGVLADKKRGALREVAEPFGVVFLLGTWNYPLFLNLVPLCQALVAGNAVVWKASELAPLSAQAVVEALEEADLPPGVAQVLIGDSETGRLLVKAGSDKLALIGSARTGRAVLEVLAVRGTPSVMELSGNDCAIVCEDAPLDLAARSLVWARTCNAGQSCISPQRVYVHSRVAETFSSKAAAAANRVDRNWWTPLRTAELRQIALERVREAVAAGARLLAGSLEPPEGPGNWMVPTVLAGCNHSMRVLSEELFAPVLALSTFDEEGEAVAAANSTAHALGASIWTRNSARGKRLAGQIRAGLVTVNEVLLDAARPQLALGGRGASGFGKMRGAAGLEEFVVRKAVVAHSPGGARRHLFPYRRASVELLRATIRWRGGHGWFALPQLIRAVRAWRVEEQQGKADPEEPATAEGPDAALLGGATWKGDYPR